MKNSMKRIIGIFIVVVMVFGTVVPSFASTSISDAKLSEATQMADELKELGLFLGTNKGYELERVGTRTEAIVMLLRLLGEAKIAEKSNYSNPFKDVPSWATKYVAYAYEKGYTTGISSTKFGSNNTTSSAQYITFVLRALGYSEKEDGYTWNNPYAFATEKGLMTQNEYSSRSEFLRADIVIISYRALDIEYNNESYTLREKLFGNVVPEPDNTTGDVTIAGNFCSENLVTINKSADYETNRDKINGMISNTYGYWYTPKLTKDGANFGDISLIYDNDTNRYGMKIAAWRHSYDSNTAQNSALNAVLETLYALCGDKSVAKSLWSWVDACAINGYANTDDYGFKDTDTFENGFTAVKNGVSVDITSANGITTIYFN